MNADKDKLLDSLFANDPEHDELNSLTEIIIGCAFKVGNTLGCGFLEKVYENALAIELRKAGLQVEQQKKVAVLYDGAIVGDYEADFIVNDLVIVELKAVRDLNQVHRAQCHNYLRATAMKLCLLINFGNPRVEVKRIIL